MNLHILSRVRGEKNLDVFQPQHSMVAPPSGVETKLSVHNNCKHSPIRREQNRFTTRTPSWRSGVHKLRRSNFQSVTDKKRNKPKRKTNVKTWYFFVPRRSAKPHQTRHGELVIDDVRVIVASRKCSHPT